MKILYLAPDVDLSRPHGGYSHVKNATESLSKLGHAVKVIAGGSKNRYLKQVHHLLTPILTTFYYCLFNKTDLIYERGRIFSGFPQVIGRIFGKKTVYEVIEPFAGIKTTSGFLQKLVKAWYDFTTKFSGLILITHRSMISGSGNNYFITHTGTDPKLFSPKKAKKSKNKIVLYSGSFAKWHACENIIKAAKITAGKNKNIKFLMIGTGENFENCRNLAEKLKLKNVSFPGEVNYGKMPSYINSADICLALFDRTYEPFRKFDYFYSPIKVHEYKSCGKPIIASGIGTLKELVKHKVNGLQVNEQNPAQIANAIVFLIKNKKLADKMGALNRKEVLEKYNWDKINSEILAQINKQAYKIWQ